jgi:hypothetical protein
VNSFDLGVHPCERRHEDVADVLVELLILLVANLGLRPRPQRRRLVHLLVFLGDHLRLFLRIPPLLLHEDGKHDVVGVAA